MKIKDIIQSIFLIVGAYVFWKLEEGFLLTIVIPLGLLVLSLVNGFISVYSQADNNIKPSKTQMQIEIEHQRSKEIQQQIKRQRKSKNKE